MDYFFIDVWEENTLIITLMLENVSGCWIKGESKF